MNNIFDASDPGDSADSLGSAFHRPTWGEVAIILATGGLCDDRRRRNPRTLIVGAYR